jgi:predicted nucleotide-binding protein
MPRGGLVPKKIADEVPTNGSGPDEAVSDATPKRVQVSQADIPAYSLEEAMRVPKAIVDNYNGKPTTPLRVAAAMKVGPTTGPFKMITGAAIAYGLTSGGGQSAQIELTPLGLRIFKPKKEGDDLIAKREAFLKPRVIGQFLRQYDGGPVPRTDIAVNVLSGDMGVPEKRAGDVFEMILAGARSLGLITTIRDRLYVSLDGVDTGDSEAENYDPDETIETIADETDKEEPEDRIIVTGKSAAAPEVAETNKRVFITHGKNKDFLDPIKKLISYGKYVPVVAVEKTSVSKPMPDKVMGMMRSCGAAIIHVDADQVITDENKTQHIILNPNVLIEIGAAQALYGRRFILLVREGVKLPSNLQGLSEVRYSGEKMDSDVTLALLDALQDIQNYELPDRYNENPETED